VRLLLDTHTLLWWLNDSVLRPAAREAIADPRNDVYVSAASAWEISIKQALGKLTVPSDVSAQITADAFEFLPISVAHGFAAGSLPRHHDDPLTACSLPRHRSRTWLRCRAIAGSVFMTFNCLRPSLVPPI